MIEWKDNFNTNNKLIDAHHKELFNILNRLFVLNNDKLKIDKYDEIVSIIEELKQYTVFHFTSEERYMESIHYKHIVMHKVMHKNFIKSINEIDYNKLDHDQESYLSELINFLTKWLVDHILNIDKNIECNSDIAL